ncbi:MAG: ABC transporter permease, partial [Oscillospiraceae bacterium]
MNRLAKHLKPYRVQIFLALAAVIGGALAELGLPYFLADIVDRGVAQGDMKAISSIGGVMLALALLSILCALAAGYLAARISAGMGLSLRQQVFDHIGTFALADVERFGTASLITRSTNDVTQIQNVVMMLIRMVLRAPIVAVGGIVLAWSKSPTLAMVLLLAMPVLIVFVVLIARMALPLSGIMQTRVDRVNLVMREKLTGARVIRAFGNEAYERERFAQASDGLMHTATSMQRTTSLLMPVVNLVMSGTMVGLVWKGALLASYGGVQVGDIMALVQYATQILMAAMMLSMMFVMLPRAMASAQRINEVLDL